MMGHIDFNYTLATFCLAYLAYDCMERLISITDEERTSVYIHAQGGDMQAISDEQFVMKGMWFAFQVACVVFLVQILLAIIAAHGA